MTATNRSRIEFWHWFDIAKSDDEHLPELIRLLLILFSDSPEDRLARAVSRRLTVLIYISGTLGILQGKR